MILSDFRKYFFSSSNYLEIEMILKYFSLIKYFSNVTIVEKKIFAIFRCLCFLQDPLMILSMKEIVTIRLYFP